VEAPIPVDIVVENVAVYSGTASAPVVASIAIRDGKFLSINLADERSYQAKESALDVESFAEFGVTSIRDVGGYLERLKSVERQIASGTVQGPSIYPSYFMLNGESFADYQRAVTNEAEIKVAIDELVSAGAAQVKVHRALSPEMLPVVVKLAHERGMRVTGHIPLGVHPLEACQTGMDGIEHVGSFVEALVSVAPDDEKNSQRAIEYLLSETANPIYECLAERQVTVTPTLVIYPAIAARRAAGSEIPPEFIEFIESMKRITYRLYESNVTLLAGTDTSDFGDLVAISPGISIHDEMALLEEAGIPPSEIITMASENAARSMGIANSKGSIQAGSDADFVMLSADPGESVRNFQTIVLVYQMGQLVFRAPK
jgi:imidazolonepropionase-like amidohydrolase